MGHHCNETKIETFETPNALGVLKVLIFVSTPSASYYIQSSHICPQLSSYSPIKTRWRLGAHSLLNFSALSLCSPSLSLCLVKFPSRESFDWRNSSGSNHSIASTHYKVLVLALVHKSKYLVESDQLHSLSTTSP